MVYDLGDKSWMEDDFEDWRSWMDGSGIGGVEELDGWRFRG